MASVLTVAERLGMTVVGEPKAFEKLDREPQDVAAPLAGLGGLVTAHSVAPLVRRTAGLSLRGRVALPRTTQHR